VNSPALSRGGGFNEGEWMVMATSGDGMLGTSITSQGHGFRCAVDADVAD
jgi:hypothetical protein